MCGRFAVGDTDGTDWADWLSLDPDLGWPPAGWPTAWGWSNYLAAWRAADFDRFYANSLFVAIVVTVVWRPSPSISS